MLQILYPIFAWSVFGGGGLWIIKSVLSLGEKSTQAILLMSDETTEPPKM